MKGVNLKDANLKGARLSQGPEDTSTMDRMARVVKKIAGDYTNSLESCDLRNAKLIGATLQGAVLVECALNGANFKGANFREADLRAADLRGRSALPKNRLTKLMEATN